MERILVGSFVILCAFFDCWSRKVPNWLCILGAVSGFVVLYYISGIAGMLEGFAFAVVICVVLMPFWYLGVLGGGDVKLMMVCGLYLKRQVFVLLSLALFCTACYSFVLMVTRKNLKERMHLFFQYIKSCLLKGVLIYYPFNREREDDVREAGVPVSYGVFAGFVIGILTGLLG